MIDQDMALLRYSGVLEILEKEKKMTLQDINKLELPDVVYRILKTKTEEFCLCGFRHTLNPLRLSEIEREVLADVTVDLKVHEAKMQAQMASFFLGSFKESLVNDLSQVAIGLGQALISPENKDYTKQSFLKMKSDDMVEALGKQHMEKAERERLAGRTAT